jgi:hypothetical protein
MELMRAGADATPVEDGVMRTPGQWLHWLLEKDADDRLAAIGTIFGSLEIASECMSMDHKGFLGQLQQTQQALQRLAGILDKDGQEWAAETANVIRNIIHGTGG